MSFNGRNTLPPQDDGQALNQRQTVLIGLGFNDGLVEAPFRRSYEAAPLADQTAYENGRLLGAVYRERALAAGVKVLSPAIDVNDFKWRLQQIIDALDPKQPVNSSAFPASLIGRQALLADERRRAADVSLLERDRATRPAERRQQRTLRERLQLPDWLFPA